MKKITLVFVVLAMTVGTAFTQNSEKKWAIGVGPGVAYNMEVEKAKFFGDFYISRYLSPRFDLMLDNRSTIWFFDKDDSKNDFANMLLNLRLKLYKEEHKVQPYLFGGIGYLWENEDDHGVNFDAGAGLKFPISPNTSLYVACSYVNGIEAEQHGKKTTDNYIMATSIIEFAFGKSKDSDADGVSDRKDECPNTPPGVLVDEKGCPIDTDGDGVPDYKDDCPDAAGSAALNGCPDKDADGIADKDDKCPDVAGLAKFGGCPDADGDGIIDANDKCANTPKGCPVDVNGCALDSDGDGVIDFEDKCPQKAGPASNKGCPAKWETLTISPVYFDFDKANIKPEYKEELNNLAGQLDAAKEYEIVIGGHTCNIGSMAYNMKLSEKRAKAVVKYLLMKGVNNTYVGSNYYGESKPAAKNDSSKHRKLNRRAEFEVAKVKK